MSNVIELNIPKPTEDQIPRRLQMARELPDEHLYALLVAASYLGTGFALALLDEGAKGRRMMRELCLQALDELAGAERICPQCLGWSDGKAS